MVDIAEFYGRVIRSLVESGNIAKSHSVFVACGGSLDREVLLRHEFTNVTISNIDRSQVEPAFHPYRWEYQDIEHLTCPDEKYDVSIVHAGLHHCHSPHRGLLELYRVARKAVIVFEARDSALLRIAQRLGLTEDYEVEAVTSEGYRSGGVANGPIPNFIYRWTEREVEKTIKSFEPRFVPAVQYYYGLRLPHQRLAHTDRPLARLALRIMAPVAAMLEKLAPRQCNEFAFAVLKEPRVPQAWLAMREGGYVVDRTWAAQAGRDYGSSP